MARALRTCRRQKSTEKASIRNRSPCSHLARWKRSSTLFPSRSAAGSDGSLDIAGDGNALRRKPSGGPAGNRPRVRGVFPARGPAGAERQRTALSGKGAALLGPFLGGG